MLQLLHKAIEYCNSKICFFIDALDEFHAYDGQDDLNPHEVALHENVSILLETNKCLWEVPSVKLCLASRPGNVFDLAFANTELLDLERLNETDIEIYVNGKLGLWVGVNLAEKLSALLLRKSSGIFLWPKLAVDSVLEGVANDDNPEDMEKRLNELPPGLESMYHHMLQSWTLAISAMLLYCSVI